MPIIQPSAFAVSLQMVMSLTDWSLRTIRRRISDGLLPCAPNDKDHKTLVYFDAVKPFLCIALDDDAIELVLRADAGDGEAQCDLAVLFLLNNKPKSAVVWLELAAKKNVADAMQLLGCCYLKGEGLVKDGHLAVMWIAKAASLGHALAIAQLRALGMDNGVGGAGLL